MPATPTRFAADLPLRGLAPTLYALTRFEWLGLPAARVLTIFWLLLAVISAFNLIPFAPLWLIAAVALLLLQWLLIYYWQPRRFIHYRAQTAPLTEAVRLPIDEKLPVFVTGLCHVEGKYQRFTALPGFYRTFATGEHALLCQARERKWGGILAWPEEEVGMWYAFVAPTAITHLAWGEARFGISTLPTIAVTYALELPAGPRRKQSKRIEETVYIAAAPTDAARLYADLLHQLPDSAVITRTP
jgi:hypothetical protein